MGAGCPGGAGRLRGLQVGGRVTPRGFWASMLSRVTGCVAGDAAQSWTVLSPVGLGWSSTVGVTWGCGSSWGLTAGSQAGVWGGRGWLLGPRAPGRLPHLGPPAHTPAPTGQQDRVAPERPQHVPATAGALHQVPGESEGQARPRGLQRGLERVE